MMLVFIIIIINIVLFFQQIKVYKFNNEFFSKIGDKMKEIENMKIELSKEDLYEIYIMNSDSTHSLYYDANCGLKE